MADNLAAMLKFFIGSRIKSKMCLFESHMSTILISLSLNVLSSYGQTIVTLQRHISQNYWSSISKPRANDHNISTQHMATLLDSTCCARFAILLRRVASCLMFQIELVRMPRCNNGTRTWPISQQHPQMLHENFDHFQT